MGVRAKTITIIGLVFLAATAATWGATVGLIQSEYIKLEADNVSKDTARSVDALGAKVDQLALKIPDWSSWDDTYQFIADHNQDYLDSNVQNSALQNLSINFMVFINAKQQIVESVGVDTDTGDSIPLPAELTKAIAPGGKLLATRPDDAWSGILYAKAHPIIIATRPILRTDGTGPLRGTLVFAQYLTPAGVAKLGEITHLSVAYDPPLAPGGALVSEAAGASTTKARTQTKGASAIEGFQLINDIYGKPVLVAHVTETRSIYQETQRTLLFYMIVVAAVTFAALLVAIYTTGQIRRQD
ncbi:MAG TPA: CHASE4 domain-containing protein, partial [Candidatus Saccharimonadia bacterium]|nr:CHASE4 domain-containing protein [Candidatus Saccharimonadia bacterium]